MSELERSDCDTKAFLYALYKNATPEAKCNKDKKDMKELNVSFLSLKRKFYVLIPFVPESNIDWISESEENNT